MVLNLYPQYTHDHYEGKELEFSSDIDQACNDIHDACDGLGTDEDKLDETLGTKSASDRFLISIRYKQLFEKELVDVIKSETSGQYGKLLQLLCLPVDQADAQIIRDATKGAGTTEKLIYPVVCGRSNAEIELLKKAYFLKYDEDLVVRLNEELSGDLAKFTTTALQELTAEYDPEVHNDAKAEEIADIIYDAGQGKWGTDEKGFYKALVTTPTEIFPQVDHFYCRKYENTLEKAVKKEFGGKVEDCMVYYVGMQLEPYITIAELFESTMKGFGTDEDGLTCAIVRYHSVLPQVKEAYEKKYGKSLRDRIHGETSGQYRNLLMKLVNTE